MMDLFAKYWFILLYFFCFLIFGIVLGLIIFSNSTKTHFVRKVRILSRYKKFIVFSLLLCGMLFFGYITVGSISFMIKLEAYGKKMPAN